VGTLIETGLLARTKAARAAPAQRARLSVHLFGSLFATWAVQLAWFSRGDTDLEVIGTEEREKSLTS
jgi:hypothetical protein